MKTPRRRPGRKLLVASLGVASVSYVACGGDSTSDGGNKKDSGADVSAGTGGTSTGGAGGSGGVGAGGVNTGGTVDMDVVANLVAPDTSVFDVVANLVAPDAGEDDGGSVFDAVANLVPPDPDL